jgi:hypothetical protein
MKWAHLLERNEVAVKEVESSLLLHVVERVVVVSALLIWNNNNNKETESVCDGD